MQAARSPCCAPRSAFASRPTECARLSFAGVHVRAHRFTAPFGIEMLYKHTVRAIITKQIEKAGVGTMPTDEQLDQALIYLNGLMSERGIDISIIEKVETHGDKVLGMYSLSCPCVRNCPNPRLPAVQPRSFSCRCA